MQSLFSLSILLLEEESPAAYDDARAIEALGFRVRAAVSPAQARAHASAADLVVIAVNPGSGKRLAAVGSALLKEFDLPLVLWVADEAADELEEFDAFLYFAAVPRSSAPVFLQKALQLSPGRAGFRREHLRKETQLQAALEGGNIGVWELDLNTKECFFSPEWKAMIGFDPREDLSTLSDWESRVHPDDLPGCYSAMQCYFEGQADLYQVVYRLRGKDGHYHWINSKARISARDVDSKPARLVGTHIDITERKQAELLLQQWEAVFSHANWGVVISSEDGLRIAQANPAFDRMHGFAPGELAGSLVLDLFAPESREDAAAHIRLANEKGHHAFESLHMRRNSEIFPVLVDATVVRDETGGFQYRVVNVQDISARKAAEEKLRRSEEKYRALFEHMQEGFALQEVILDEQGKVVDFRTLEANAAYEVHTGIKRENVVGRTLLEIQPNADRDQIERYGRVAQTGEPLTYEYFSRTFNRHIRVSAFCPRPGHFATVFEDISEMRQAEEALRENMQKFRVLFENQVYAIVIFEPDSLRILDANQALLDLYGYERDELLSTFTVLDLSAEGQTSLESIRETVRSGSSYIPLRYHRRKDGSLFPVEVAAEPFTWQGRSAMFGIIHNITRRITAEQRLRESEERFRHMADTAPVLIWMSGIDAQCDYFNSIWLEYTGRALEQELGNGWAEGVHPDDRERCMEIYGIAFGQHRPFEMEYRLRRANGEYGWVFDRGVPRFTPAREFIGYIGSCIDITERKKNEEQIRFQAKLLAEVKQAVIATDLEGRYIYWNPYAENLFGYRAEDVLGKINTNRFDDPDLLRLTYTARQKMLQDNVWKGEMQVFGANKKPLYLEVTASLLLDEQGLPAGYISTMDEISQRKQTEEAMRRANEQLQSHLAAIEQLQEELRHQALHDPLTGLHNRYYLTEALEQEIIRSERDHTPLCVVMVDIDHFKAINDNHGHPVGDRFLIEIADLMKNNVRGSDIVSRYGGEEFLIVLPGTSMECALKRAEVLRRKCAEITIAHEGSDLTVTLSFGLAEFPQEGSSTEELIKKADQAMYCSKANGRNRVTGWRGGKLMAC